MAEFGVAMERKSNDFFIFPGLSICLPPFTWEAATTSWARLDFSGSWPELICSPAGSNPEVRSNSAKTFSSGASFEAEMVSENFCLTFFVVWRNISWFTKVTKSRFYCETKPGFSHHSRRRRRVFWIFHFSWIFAATSIKICAKPLATSISNCRSNGIIYQLFLSIFVK